MNSIAISKPTIKASNKRNLTEKLDTARIKMHLLRAELHMRAQDTSGLSSQLLSRRQSLIEELKQYRKAGFFPTRIDGPTSGRFPRFIGANGAYCAIGFLMVRTGEHALVHEVSNANNGVYVNEIADSRFDNWLEHNGISKDEAARIQPTYREQVGGGDLDWITILISLAIAIFTSLILQSIILKKAKSKKVAYTLFIGSVVVPFIASLVIINAFIRPVSTEPVNCYWSFNGSNPNELSTANEITTACT